MTATTQYPPLSHHEIHLWALQMHLLLSSGMPLHEGLELLASSEDLPRISTICDQLADGISQGQRLSQSMRSLNPTFGELVVNFVAVGERSGKLPEVFSRISERALRRGKTEHTVQAALAYPIFLTVVCGAMAGFMAFYMFPQLMPFLKGLGVTLPWPTRTLLWLTSHLTLLLVIFTVLAGWAGFLLASKTNPWATRVRDWLTYKSPVIGRLNRNRVYADCLADLHLLLEAQCDLLVSLSSLRPPWDEQRERILVCVHEIGTGLSFSEAVEKSGMLPRWFLSPMSSAEETGQFSNTFKYLSEQLEEAVIMDVERLLQLLEPMLMAGMGLVTGFVVLATFLPLYSMTSSI